MMDEPTVDELVEQLTWLKQALPQVVERREHMELTHEDHEHAARKSRGVLATSVHRHRGKEVAKFLRGVCFSCGSRCGCR